VAQSTGMMRAYRLSGIRTRAVPYLWVTGFCLIAGLLGIVGAMQYRSVTQLTEATEARIGGNVESLMMDWHLDLYHRLSAICVALQVGPDSGAFDDWQAFGDRYGQWRRTVDNPELVDHVYIWETSVERPQLLRLDAGGRLPQRVEPAGEYGVLLERLQARSDSLYAGLRAWQLNDPERSPHGVNGRNAGQIVVSTGWQFDEAIPALVHPIVHHKLPEEVEQPGSAGKQVRDGAIDWIVVVLDSGTIRKTILPELNRRHFETAGTADYAVVVATLGKSRQILYDSFPESPGDKISQSDAVMNIFGPPPQSTEGNVWEAVKNANAVKAQSWHHFSGPIWFPVVHYAAEEDPWMLVLTHRTGRLEDRVAKIRRVYLLGSAVVLLLLAASVSLVAAAAVRERNYARMQMDFVASISHELRTPLAGILSAGQNLADGVVEQQAQQQNYGKMITSQARQLMNLVDQILTFALNRSGEKQFAAEPVKVTEIVELALRNTGTAVGGGSLQIEQTIEPDLPVVTGDLGALAACLQNLLVNAIKYGGKPKWVGLSAGLADRSRGREIRISVEDRGLGMEAAELKQIFRPFYRSPRVKSAQIHGTGLGLAVAKEIAEAMGGELTVESELGRGSRFTIHLPVD
jgi:two-component system sensor histidine kinase SenX3